MQLNIVETPEQLQRLENTLKDMPIFAFDTETTGLDWTRNSIFLLSFSEGVNSWVIPVNRFKHSDLCQFMEIVMKDDKSFVIGQNLKFDAHHLKKTYGVTIERQWHDTQLMAYMMDENRSNSLKKLMPTLLGLDPGDETKIHAWMKEHQGKRENWDFSKVPEELMLPYSGMDPFATFQLYLKLRPGIKEHFADLYNTDRQVLKILWKLEQNGVHVDRQKLEQFVEPYEARQADYKRRMFEAAGYEFNPDSPDDLVELLYNKLKFPITFYTAKSTLDANGKPDKTSTPSTGDDALMVIDHPVAEYLRLYRQQGNALNYAKGLLEKQDADGLVHGDYSMTRTKTGRFSCSDPNLQNVPKNKELRRCFVATPGFDMFYFDHAQIEMVGFAHYSKDPKMMAALKAGHDLHALAASEVYGIPIDQVTKEQRAVGKGTNFSIIYGVGKKKLATYINGYMNDGKKLTSEEAQLFKQKYFNRFPSVTQFQYQAQQAVRNNRPPWGHYIKNQFGRVRRITEPDKKAYTAVNHLIQGWAPDLMKKAMVKIENTFHPYWRQNVHDELRIDLPQGDKHRHETVKAMVDALTNFPDVRVPINCKVEWSSKDWAELKIWEGK